VSQLSNPEYNSAYIGLLGVLVGAFISYCFNKKIYREEAQSRFSIQRKNLIFSKLYKELIIVKKSLESLPSDGFYFEINIEGHGTGYRDDHFYIADESYSKVDFFLWHEMKNDIRKTQVPERIKLKLDAVENALYDYFDLLNEYKKQCEEKEAKTNKKMIEIYQKGIGNQNSKFCLNYHKSYYKDFNIKHILEDNVKNFGSTENNELKDEIKTVLEAVIDTTLLKKIELQFELVKTSIDEAYTILDKTIQDIVNKYEYGNKI